MFPREQGPSAGSRPACEAPEPDRATRQSPRATARSLTWATQAPPFKEQWLETVILVHDAEFDQS